jgi:NAD-dependent DNA ligase
MRQNTETVKELVARLSEADTAYYKHDNPIITDREYDKFIKLC